MQGGVGGEIRYPGDPVLKPIAIGKLRNETIRIYESGFVGVFQEDGSFAVTRCD